MPSSLNSTHDPHRRSWLDTANDPGTDFPLQNLPYGVFRTAAMPRPQVGVAIGDHLLALAAAATHGLLPDGSAGACREPTLNALMALRPAAWSELRARLSQLLGDESCPAGPQREAVRACLVPLRDAELLLPARVGDYTDFYASAFHATHVGAMFRPENPLLPNYKWVPVGYHGRASSIVASGADIRRPLGQSKAAEAAAPAFGPSEHLDYELELGAFIGAGNRLGSPLSLAGAEDHIFGVCLLNDWSARDLQAWEYQPLGPFLAKNFATTISPWVIPLEALAPFRTPAFARPPGDPAPLPYLADAADQDHGGLDLTLEVFLLTPRMRADGDAPQRISSGNFATMYWTLAQLVAHHTSNGCNLCPGDLLGSGTVSGPEKSSWGCLLELTWRGHEPLVLANGERRGFLHDGDEVILRGYAERHGARRIGLGECRGTVVPAGA